MDNEQKARDAAAALLPYVSPAMSEQDMEGYTSPLSAGEPELALMWLLGYAGLPQTHAPRDIILDAVAALPDDDKDDYAYLLD